MLVFCEVLLSPQYAVFVSVDENIARYTYYFTTNCSAISLALSVTIRAWFLLFDIKYAESIRSSQWWSIISPNITTPKQTMESKSESSTMNNNSNNNSNVNSRLSNLFWVKYKNKYGNGKYILKCVLIFGIIIAISEITLIVVLNLFNFSLVFTTTVVLLLLLITGFIWKQLPIGIIDAFYIRNEIKYFSILYGIGGMAQFIMGAIETRDTVIAYQISSVMGLYVFHCQLNLFIKKTKTKTDSTKPD